MEHRELYANQPYKGQEAQSCPHGGKGEGEPVAPVEPEHGPEQEAPAQVGGCVLSPFPDVQKVVWRIARGEQGRWQERREDGACERVEPVGGVPRAV